ncbi:unnamed protein product [Symbiodinium sp. CCMP2456]|nr:unnamed protein product [Symbiodinium sp. CCMP2456]
MAVFPLTPAPDREGIIVFLDARQTGNFIDHIFLPGSAVDPLVLIRYLHLQAPPAHRIVFWPRTDRDGMLRLTEGSVVEFGFVEEGLWDSEEDSGSEDAASSDRPDSDGSTHPGHTERATSAPVNNRDPTPGTGSASDPSARSRSPSRAREGQRDAIDSPSALPLLCKKAGSFCKAMWSRGAGDLTPLSCLVFSSWFQGLPGSILELLRPGEAPTERPQHAKLLEEPTPTCQRDLEALDALTIIAQEFGQPWRYWPAWRLQERLELMPPIPVFDDVIVAPVVIPVAVLTPGYAAEHFSVEVFLPGDIRDVTLAVQAARGSRHVRRFPILLPALPQPSSEWLLFLAQPEWEPQAIVVVVDARVYDGRLWAIQAPQYVDHGSFLRLAGLPDGAQVTVHTSLDVGILLHFEETRLFPGQCLCVLPDGRPAPPVRVVDSMLLSTDGWGTGVAFPEPDTPACYCCVTDRGHHLYAANAERPWAFRQEIADSCSLPVGRLQLCPAKPRVEDCTVFGWPCRTVLGVGLNTVDSVFVIVDCRPIMQGWSLVRTRGQVAVRDLLEDLGVLAPSFWEPIVHSNAYFAPQTEGVLHVTEGQVVVIEYRLQAIEEPVEHEQDMSDIRAFDPDSDEDMEGEEVILRWHQATMVPPMSNTSCVSQLLALSWLLIQTATAVQLPDFDFLASGRASMCPPVSSVDALAPGPQADTSALPELGVEQVHLSRRRPLPTPCRARQGQDIAAHAANVGSFGSTLLEQAAQAPTFQGFFLAATLLEVLFEHGQALAHDGRALVNPPPRVLSLNDCIPLTPFQVLAQSLTALVPPPPRAGDSYEGNDWLDADLSHLTRSSQIEARWRGLFQDVPKWWAQHPQPPRPEKIEIYTDGSAPGGADPTEAVAAAAWAFTVWAISAGTPFFVGGAAHTLVPAGTPYHVGECTDTSLEAELAAIAWALIWALEHGVRFQVWLEFCYDATAAGGGAFGESRCPCLGETGSGLGATAVLLRQAVATRVPVSHRHVKGHSGILPNELCDCLAKAARRSPECPYSRMLPTWPEPWARHQLRQWTWLAHASCPSLPVLTALEAEAGRLQCQAHEVLAPTAGLRTSHYRATEVEYSFKALSFNALSLFDPAAPPGREARVKNQGLLIAGKRDLLKRQLLEQHIWAAGIQETRLPTSETLPDGDFLMLSTEASPQGHYGCALWLNLALPFASEKGLKHRVSRSQVTVTSVSPRHLQAQVSAPRLRLTILVAHGPSGVKDGGLAAREFWTARAQDLRARAEGSEILILADANAHLGTIETEAVGGHDPEQENAAGAAFHECLLDLDCFLPSTFVSCHHGPSSTWHGPSAPESGHRLDYVAVPSSWRHLSISTWVWVEFESLQARQDHQPVCLQVLFGRQQAAASYTVSTRRAPRPVLRQTPTDQVRRGTFLDALHSSGPQEPWWAGIDSHCESVSLPFVKAAEAICVKQPQRPRQPYLQPDTLLLVQRRAAVRVYLSTERAELNRRLKMLGFAAFVLSVQSSGFSDAARTAASRWFYEMDISIAAAVDAQHWLTSALRSAVKRDRIAFLQGLTDQISVTDLKDPLRLYAAVRRAFPKAKASRRASFQALPAVRLKDGTLAKDPAERADRWTAHFGDQEAGEVTALADYESSLGASPFQPIRGGPHFDYTVLPSLLEALTSHGLATPVPSTTAHPPWTTGEPVDRIGCAAWADDYTHAQAASQASELCDRVLTAAGILSEHATAAGMQLTFAPDKTAVLLASDCDLKAETRLVSDEQGRSGFYVQNKVLQCRHFLPLVASYKHLGGIVTSNATPGADNQFRFSQAQATLRPLYGRLFSATGIPLAIRRTLLRALVISKFVFSGASALLATTIYRRQWCQMYVSLWRGLCRWPQRDRTPHSYEVLRRAQAASPLLALAQMRAILLQRVLRHGPSTLQHLLHVHWRAAGAKSWLGLFVEDLHAVAPFAPAAAVVLNMSDPVEILLEKASAEPTWWPAQVRRAVKGFICRLEKWDPGFDPVAAQTEVPDSLPFVCRWCDAAFRLRKHLAVHEARRHGSLCPARHFTPTRECQACLKLFHSVERCMYHVKTSRSCLLRLVHMFPPMDLPTIRLAEQEDSRRRKALRGGHWQAFVSTTPVSQAFGPRAPVYSDIFLGLSEDEIPVSRLGFYRPSPVTLQWILDYIEGASVEGPRQSATSFWLRPIPIREPE